MFLLPTMADGFFTTPDGRQQLDHEILLAYLQRQRWFGGKGRQAVRCSILKEAPLGPARLLAVEVKYWEGPDDWYCLPVAISNTPSAEASIITRFPHGWALFDAVSERAFREALFALMAGSSAEGEVRGEGGRLLREMFPGPGCPESRVLAAEQSNTSLIYGEKLFVKLYRRIVPGVNPDAEITRFLSERAGFRHVPAFGGSVMWGEAQLLLALELRPNDGNAWELALREFRALMESEDRIREWGQQVELLGQRTGEFHRALYDVGNLPAELSSFIPRKLSGTARDRLREKITSMPANVEELLREITERHAAAWEAACRGAGKSRHAASAAARLPAMIRAQFERTGALAGGDVTLTRTHGDYHLGQVLCAAGDFVLIDFEGEPARPLEERRAQQPPIRDVAGMLRSFHYAAHAACGEANAQWAEVWAATTQQEFLRGWRKVVAGTSIADERLLDFYLLEKLIYEVRYEMNNRPDWVHIPLRGLATLAGE